MNAERRMQNSELRTARGFLHSSFCILHSAFDHVGLPLITGVFVLLLWYAAVRFSGTKIFPSPLDVGRAISQLAEKNVQFKVLDDPAIDTSSRTGKLVMGILALIAEFENDIRRERQMDGIRKAHDRGVRFGRKPLLVSQTIQQVRKLRKAGKTVPEIMRQTDLSKASVYRALGADKASRAN
jgi:DNA invertase Pin-like site-specific DNA recombinase